MNDPAQVKNKTDTSNLHKTALCVFDITVEVTLPVVELSLPVVQT